MVQISNEKFGLFVAELRREKNWTQKELAEKLYVSDKTVSKWERGMSMPIQYNNDKSEKPSKIKGLSDLSLFFFHLFSIKNQPKTKGQKGRCYINDKSEL